MAGNTGPNIVNNGLILNLDAANIKSFRGLSGTNLWYNLNRTFSSSNTSTFKVSYGTEKVYIPYFNGFIDTTYCDIYNDYVGGSGQCCPSPFYYHGPNVTVSGNTQYTYQLIFKTTNGYYSTNYMYRYEFGASGLLIEQGLVDASRLESLGNGWYHAWGQFTTNASTTNMTGWLFHYEYLVMNRISVAAVSLTQGSTIHRPEHLINFGFRETRGTTVTTGGGWKDLCGNSNHCELVNGPTYNSNNRGSLVFDGTNNYGEISNNISLVTNTVTVSLWCKHSELNVYRTPFTSEPISTDTKNGYGFRQRIDNVWWWTIGKEGSGDSVSVGMDNVNTWVNLVGTYNGSTVQLYKNGVISATTSSTRVINFTNVLKIGSLVSNGDKFYGNISNITIYNRVLSSNEILQNFNSQKTRFGL